jgi:hypothetical protein
VQGEVEIFSSFSMPLFIGPNGDNEMRPSTEQLLEKHCQPSTSQDISLQAILNVLTMQHPEAYDVLRGTREEMQTIVQNYIRLNPLAILDAYIIETQRIEQTLRIENEIRSAIKRLVAPLLVRMQEIFRRVHGLDATMTDSLAGQNIQFIPDFSSLRSFFDSLHHVMTSSINNMVADLFQRHSEIIDQHVELEQALAERTRMYGGQYVDYNEQNKNTCELLGIPPDRVNRNLFGIQDLLRASYLTPIRWYLRIFESAIRSQRRQRRAGITPEGLRTILQTEHQHVELYTQLPMQQFRSMEDQLFDGSPAHNRPEYIWMSYDMNTHEPQSIELHEKLFIDRGTVLSPTPVKCPGRGQYLAEMQAMIRRVLDECIIPHLAQLNALAVQEETAGA